MAVQAGAQGERGAVEDAPRRIERTAGEVRARHSWGGTRGMFSATSQSESEPAGSKAAASP